MENIYKIGQALFNHKAELAGATAIVGSGLVHGYQVVVNGGGYRGIFRKFRDGADQPKPAAPASLPVAGSQ